MGNRAGERHKGPKCIAILGPLASGKTTLFEAILARTGAIARQTSHGNSAGEHAMSVEASFATTRFMDESITFVDCPGSIEFAHEAEPILAAADAAVVVVDAEDSKLPMLQLVLRRQLRRVGRPQRGRRRVL